MIAVIIPCYRVKAHILDVISKIGETVAAIYVVDDACPEQSGAFVEEHCRDPRVRVLRNSVNLGVGGAVLAGYDQAMADGATILVKIDGDGQMDPGLVPSFTAPILEGLADYTKGNRFYSPKDLRDMPPLRLFGNAVLSFLSKLSTGYWSIFDPTNGYTAIHAAAYRLLQSETISPGYFFESDMLFRLNLIRAVVVDIPMKAVYGDEVSNLSIAKVLPQFMRNHLVNIGKRIFYCYFLRDFSPATLELLFGLILLGFGTIFGAETWYSNASLGRAATSGTVMLAALPIMLGLQLLLAFLSRDMVAQPTIPIQKVIKS